MEYRSVREGRFLERPNRFIARVELDGAVETVHVKNTGRCRELLVSGCKVYLADEGHGGRKTRYDLIAVEKEGVGLINMDSQAVNPAAGEWLPQSGLFETGAIFRREVTHGNSRFDFAVEEGARRHFVEVKGVTLEQNGTALFPDAPTLRGVKHLQELEACAKEGIGAWVLFVIQMEGMVCFRPHEAMHPQFAQALRRAAEAGVRVLAVDCHVTPDSLQVKGFVPVEL